MKNIAKVLALVLVLSLVTVVFASCGKTLSGSYKGELDIAIASAEVVYKFSGSKVKVTSTYEVMGFEKTFTYDGKYEIIEEEGTQKIAFTFEDEDAEKYGGTIPFEEGDGYIKLAGVKYTKQ